MIALPLEKIRYPSDRRMGGSRAREKIVPVPAGYRPLVPPVTLGLICPAVWMICE